MKRLFSKRWRSVIVISSGIELNESPYSACMWERRDCLSSSDNSTTAAISIESLKFARLEIGIHASGSRSDAISGLIAFRSSAP
jgi:hypothetical protein